MTPTVTPSGGALGADVAGVDLAQDISDADFQVIADAWRDHSVLRFRGQQLDDEALCRFSARFGTLDNAPTRPVNIPYHPDRKEIAVISNIVEGDVPIGGLGNSELVWHQDMSYNDLPPKASLLYGIEVPAEGGDTAFYSLYAALETLPADLRQRIEGRTCKHDATRNSAGQLRAGMQAHYTNEERPRRRPSADRAPSGVGARRALSRAPPQCLDRRALGCRQ